jgi:DHA1 family bicyclomycin/chloramphenicol resistance-like MFS transporter
MTYRSMTSAIPDEAHAPAASRPPARAPLWLLALMTLSGTLAMHIFVPALPMAAADLGVSSSVIQLTLSTYIIGLALGQLTYGPISDRYGRRPVLLVGMIIYLAASLAAYLAPNIQWLLVARLFQAIGGCSGLVLGRAIVRDNAAGNEAARRLSLMNLMTMAGPGLSPLLGAFIVGVTGWRSIFAVVCLLGLANLLLIWFLLPRTPGSGGQDMRTVMVSYGRLLKSVRFLGFTIGGGFTTTAIYSFIASAPFIFSGELHQPPERVGIYLAINIAGIWLGSLTTSRLIGRLSASQIMIFGTTISFASGLVFLGFVATGTLGVTSTILPMLVFSYGAGAASPVALAEAMNINPAMAGSASGLYGFTQMMVGAACSALSGIGSDPAWAVALILVGAGIISQASFWIAQSIGKRDGASG